MPLSMRRINRISSGSEAKRPAVKISCPVIQSSTNVHLENMVDLQVAQRMMATRVSLDTGTPSSSIGSASIGSTEPDLTDGSSASSSPTQEHNHLSAYFPGPAGVAAKAAESPIAPSIPQRVPSHSKKEHERLARKRSLRGGPGTSLAAIAASPIADLPPPSIMSVNNDRSSLAMFGSAPSQPLPKLVTPAPPPRPVLSPSSHLSPIHDSRTPGPFTPELERLTEALEEQFRVAPKTDEEDAVYMRQKGLVKFDVSVYCADIGFCNPFTPIDAGMRSYQTAAWI